MGKIQARRESVREQDLPNSTCNLPCTPKAAAVCLWCPPWFPRRDHGSGESTAPSLEKQGTEGGVGILSMAAFHDLKLARDIPLSDLPPSSPGVLGTPEVGKGLGALARNV